jgi:hypothetical protein
LLGAYDPAGYGEPMPPPTPSAVQTGSVKAILLMERAHKGYGLWHPQDAALADAVASQIKLEVDDKSAGALRGQRVAADDWGPDEDEPTPADDLDEDGEMYPLARLAEMARKNLGRSRRGEKHVREE